jgi:hypothetical protein
VSLSKQVSQSKSLEASLSKQVSQSKSLKSGISKQVSQSKSLKASLRRSIGNFFYNFQGGSLKCFQLILDKYAKSTVMQCLGAFENTMLHCAVQNGRVEMTKYLLKQGVDVNARNGLTETPLHLAAGAYSKGE